MKIASKINDLNLKMISQDHLQKLKLISVSLDRVQKKFCLVSDATEEWIDLLNGIKNVCTDTEIKYCEKRLQLALTPAHYLSNILDPRYCGKKLESWQVDLGMEFISANSVEIMPEILAYKARATPFKLYLFSESTVNKVKPIVW